MSDFCLVRQPVFGTKGTLLGYEIRYRDAGDGHEALAQVFQSGTFDLIRGNAPAFLACSATQLVSNAFHVADPATLILLLPATLSADPEVVDAVVRFCEAGGAIALDGLSDEIAPVEQLAEHAAWVRLDVRQLDAAGITRIRERLAPLNSQLKVLASGVEELAQYEISLRANVDAFQGVFFSSPEPVPSTDLPQSTVAAIRLLGMARDPNVNDRKLEDVLESDPVLTFQLLQLVNSAAIGMRGVSSIGQALRMIGRVVFQRWLAVAVAASRKSATGIDQELVRQAVARGRLLEQLSGGSRDPGTMFLVGLFSLLDAVFRMPLHEILERVALSDEATAALLDRTGPYADALMFAESYELGMFENASSLAQDMGVDPATLSDLYANAVQWTAEALDSVSTKQTVGK